jgi:hypothetical protein
MGSIHRKCKPDANPSVKVYLASSIGGTFAFLGISMSPRSSAKRANTRDVEWPTSHEQHRYLSIIVEVLDHGGDDEKQRPKRGSYSREGG